MNSNNAKAPIGFEAPPPPYSAAYPQQNQNIYPQMPSETVIVTNTQAPIIVMAPVGPEPFRLACPSCHADIQTKTDRNPSTKAWLSGIILALLGCWMGCCLIPCCLDDCQDVSHNCPNCGSYIGTYKP